MEAALASARSGVQTILVTLSFDSVGRMSCNPAIGGMAKSHIVSEIDALGGEMGINADFTSIHAKTLNTRKGPAVQATRSQCDKIAYHVRLQRVIRSTPGLAVCEDEALGLDVRSGAVRGVILRRRGLVPCAAAVVCAGTFLRGRVFVGPQVVSSGRAGDRSADHLGQHILGLGHRVARLKTGTPPRLHRDSIDYARLGIQPPDAPPPVFSYRLRASGAVFHVEQAADGAGSDPSLFHVEQAGGPWLPWLPGTAQLPCYVTHTTDRTIDIIRRNLSRSALYGGMITGTGVRYCPSIEDKVVKFPEKTAHHVFIEPEGRGNVRVYPNGTSNSLPASVQVEMIRSIPGLEQARFIRPGYAIEYDFFDPRDLSHSLESKLSSGLFMAGQVNGTTGYEEAAGQGFVAGVNAARMALGLPPIAIGRQDAYLGVMIDDLVTRGTDEPYRMFTSRAEFRLLLRQDNAPYRLHELAKSIGILAPDVVSEIARSMEKISRETARLQSVFRAGASLYQILAGPGVGYRDLPGADLRLTDEEARQIETNVKYAGYVSIEAARVGRLARMEAVAVPRDLDYSAIRSLRKESAEKLARIRPETLAQAQRIPGVNPSDIALLEVFLRRSAR
ncbi:MAG: tRNA uridine-5-carboxymethylaminomethyl(34) synthesis enzyme MnmG [Verrucomicrobia bacterium A1]|nr:MAG: tRNA uridine-5-carboxymethylaminomethyl(34) synthesis enzyme MnmG [Verrucomicrobia bacterium A1]